MHKFEAKSHTNAAGNLPLALAVKNALLSVEVADTCRPPAYAGMAKPPDTVLDTVGAYTYVETRSETTYGQVIW